MKQGPQWGPTNIRRHCTKISRHGDLTPGIRASLIYCKQFLILHCLRQLLHFTVNGTRNIQHVQLTGLNVKLYLSSP